MVDIKDIDKFSNGKFVFDFATFVLFTDLFLEVTQKISFLTINWKTFLSGENVSVLILLFLSYGIFINFVAFFVWNFFYKLIYKLPFVHTLEKLQKEFPKEKGFYDIDLLIGIGQKENNQMIIDACNNAKKYRIEYNKFSKSAFSFLLLFLSDFFIGNIIVRKAISLVEEGFFHSFLTFSVSVLTISILLCAVYIYVHGYKVFWNDYVYYNRMEK